MQDKASSFFSLFASTSTLVCCALPALFVSLGAGASFASLIGVFPFLIVLSQYKIAISLFALAMIIVAGVVNYKTARMPCPADPELGRACLKTRQRSQRVYLFSTAIFVFASIFTYIVPHFI
ncbi:hypothetical protein OAU76_01285 [bacterium]|nr:hypothetical protein [bacterium]